MNIKSLCAALSTTLFFCSFLNAQTVYVAGLGGESCANLTLAYTKFQNPVGGTIFDGKTYLDEPSGYTQWMSGFVSAYNVLLAKENPKNQIQIESLAIGFWLKTYCANNPTRTIAGAADTFIKEHKRK